MSTQESSSGFAAYLYSKWRALTDYIDDKYREHVTKVLKCGAVPRHIAFIMDGNRRFARKNHKETKAGHMSGGETLQQTLKWCQELGIKEITVFAFSIENFKRATEEVTSLMQIAEEKLNVLIQSPEAKQYYRIRGIGDFHLLPIELQKRIHEIEQITKDNTMGCFNICFSYSSTNEITDSISGIVEGVENGLLEASDISQELIESCLQTFGSSEIDMLVRTSGEIRLSDFMLWQSSACCLVITDVLWPEFNHNHLYSAVLHFQEHYDNLTKIRAELEQNKTTISQETPKFKKFFEIRNQTRDSIFITR